MKKIIFLLLQIPVTMVCAQEPIERGSVVETTEHDWSSIDSVVVDSVSSEELLVDSVFEEPTVDEEASSYIYFPRNYRYRVELKDKKNNPYSVKRPEEFLSEKSIQRRKRLGVKVDHYDLPITPSYVQKIQNLGVRVHNMSKWNNTVVVETSDTTMVEKLLALPFVSNVKKVWEEMEKIDDESDSMPVAVYASGVLREEICLEALDEMRKDKVENEMMKGENEYGWGDLAVSMLNLQGLHKKGFRGDGMTIAVIDGGFRNVDLIDIFKDTKIVGTKNFAHPGISIYSEPENHGTMVLSCIVSNKPKYMVGTAPDASVLLLQSEDGLTEQLVEEDNWCAAVEYADSIGVDVITSSLGYYAFDDKSTSHKYIEQDGQTAINSRSASLAASRGLLVLNSAGNEGDGSWKKIGFPADARDILAVGAVTLLGENTIFSSIGNTADGRIKPDVMALGESTPVINDRGNTTLANGTSFSCPVMCGAVTCLWQAFPEKTPVQIIRALQKAGNNAQHPNNIYGYGVPDMMKAYEILSGKK